MTLDAWREAGRSYSHRGHSIFYRDGEGQNPLLLMHGFPTASWDWHHVWGPLSNRFRLVAPDMIGFGFSDKPYDYPYSTLDQATLHEALLAHLGIAEVDILAHDFGDTVAQELLARHEERLAAAKPGLRIRSLCLLNGGLFPEAHRARLTQRLLLTSMGPLFARLGNERSFGRSFAAVFGPNSRPTRVELHEFWRLVAHNNGGRIMHKLIGYIPERQHYRARWVGALQNTSVPMRLINGAKDPVSGGHMADRYCELVPDPDVVRLPEIGHYPQVEDPQAVLDAFLAFVDSNAPHAAS